MGTSQSVLLPLYKYMVNKMKEGEMNRSMQYVCGIEKSIHKKLEG